MPKALDPQALQDFVLPADRDLPDGHPYKTVFHLRGLTIDEEEQVANSLFGGTMGSTDLNVKSGSYQRVIINKGLDSWSNFNDVADDSNEDWTQWEVVPVEFKQTRATNGKIPSKLLDRLSSEDRTEIANAISGRGKVTAEEGND